MIFFRGLPCKFVRHHTPKSKSFVYITWLAGVHFLSKEAAFVMESFAMTANK